MPTAFFHALRATGLTKSQAARLLEVTPSAVTRWVQGSRAAPYSVLERLREYEGAAHAVVALDLGVESTADLLGIATATVYRALRSGRLLGERDETGRWRVLTSDARRFMREEYNRIPSPPVRHRIHRATAELIPGDFADRIRCVRVAMALSQAEFGELLGVAKKTVYQWEAGKRTPWPTYWRKVRAFETQVRADAASIPPV